MRLIWLVVGAVAGGVWLANAVKKDDTRQVVDEPAPTYTAPTPAPRPRREQPPTFDIREIKHAYDVRQAMEAVYARCEKYAVWREGTELEGVYVEASRKAGRGALVNVGAKLARPDVVNGHTMWFRVDLDRAGKPVEITASKSVGSGLCGVGDG